MARSSPFTIKLSGDERRELERRARKYTLAYRDVFRANVVLMAAKGMENEEIASRLNAPREVVSKWRKRFFEEGLPGLDERSRRGRPSVFPPRAGG